ncbi:MAG: nicotinate-nucleotide adenylyltransferase, partial [Bacillota bacterium]|nr:nicotinate-nucleotide adenylyltransferase [Bacillota bacterium]
SSLELEREGLSYTIDTIDYYLERLPGVEIFFIMGVDALQIINTWKSVNRVVGLCEFVVVTRPGYYLDPNEACYKEVSPVLWEHVHPLEIPGLFISSTEVRNRVASGKSIRYLLPEEVEAYIQENQLYREER